MTSFLNNVTSTLRTLFAWHGSYYSTCNAAIHVWMGWMCASVTLFPCGHDTVYSFCSIIFTHKLMMRGGTRAPDNFLGQRVSTPWFWTQCWFSKFQWYFHPLYFFAMLKIDNSTICQQSMHFYTPRNEVRGGYTGITLSVRLSVCLSVRL